MFLHSIKVPPPYEFAGASLAHEISIAVAHNHHEIPLPEHQQTFLQFLPYLPNCNNYDRSCIIKDVYNPSLTRGDVIKALSRRGSLRRKWYKDQNPSLWKRSSKEIQLLSHRVFNLSQAAKLRSMLWYAALMYATEYSKVVLAMQMISTIGVFSMFRPGRITGPRCIISLTLVGIKFLTEGLNPFKVSSSSIIIGVATPVLVVATVLFCRYLHELNDPPGESIPEKVFGTIRLIFAAYIAITGFIWMY